MANRRELFQDSEFSIETGDYQRLEDERIEALGRVHEWIQECRKRGGKWHRAKALLGGYLRNMSVAEDSAALTRFRISFANMIHRWVDKGL